MPEVLGAEQASTKVRLGEASSASFLQPMHTPAAALPLLVSMVCSLPVVSSCRSTESLRSTDKDGVRSSCHRGNESRSVSGRQGKGPEQITTCTTFRNTIDCAQRDMHDRWLKGWWRGTCSSWQGGLTPRRWKILLCHPSYRHIKVERLKDDLDFNQQMGLIRFRVLSL